MSDNITTEEQKHLAHLIKQHSTSLLYLVKEYEQAHPEIALLRSSQQPQDDATLLRAAYSTETISQEQLLRPANPNDPMT